MTSSRLCVDRHVPFWTRLGSYRTRPAHAPCMCLYRKPGLSVFRSDSDFHRTCTNIRLDDSHRSCGTIGNGSHDRFRTCIYTGLVAPSNVKTFTSVPLCALHRPFPRSFPRYCLHSIAFSHTKPPQFNSPMEVRVRSEHQEAGLPVQSHARSVGRVSPVTT